MREEGGREEGISVHSSNRYKCSNIINIIVLCVTWLGTAAVTHNNLRSGTITSAGYM